MAALQLASKRGRAVGLGDLPLPRDAGAPRPQWGGRKQAKQRAGAPVQGTCPRAWEARKAATSWRTLLRCTVA